MRRAKNRRETAVFSALFRLVGRTTALVSGVFSLPLCDPAGPARDFLASEENALVRMALRAVVSPAPEQFPLVICGPTGTGKTLLAEGLANAWKLGRAGPDIPSRSPSTSSEVPLGTRDLQEVHRTSGADFARGYADACDTDSIGDFREAAAKAGLVLVDAVHPLATKEKACREFCFQLDRWSDAGKLVIVTSLVSPLDLANPGLASRLSAGLVLPLALPSLDARRTLLEYFARERSLELPDDVLDCLAERVPGAATRTASPRDLQAALVTLEAKAKLTGCSADAKLAEALFGGRNGEHKIEFKRILSAVAKRCGTTVDELRSSSRRQSLVRARGIAILLARRLTGESLQSLGGLLGKRDHSTIHHAVRSMEEALETDEALRRLVESLQLELESTIREAASLRRGASSSAKPLADGSGLHEGSR
jgi:chromosomal replication initiator protein